MSTIIRESHPVARKKHICNICGCAIPPGVRYYNQVHDFDGFCDVKAHEECAEYYFDRVYDSDDSEVNNDGFDDCLLDDLDKIFGSEKAADAFREDHTRYECVKFIQEHKQVQ